MGPDTNNVAFKPLTFGLDSEWLNDRYGLLSRQVFIIKFIAKNNSTIWKKK